jgi:Fe(3+) dicitrate transport protein
VDYKYRWIAFNYQFAYTGDVFTDAANTQSPNANATVGSLQAYAIHDAGISVNFIDSYTLKFGVNNLTNERYATRRSGGYPGPGLLPSQGRSFYGTLSVKI